MNTVTEDEFDAAFKESCDRATAETSVPLYVGKPEDLRS